MIHAQLYITVLFKGMNLYLGIICWLFGNSFGALFILHQLGGVQGGWGASLIRRL